MHLKRNGYASVRSRSTLEIVGPRLDILLRKPGEGYSALCCKFIQAVQLAHAPDGV